MFINLDGMFLRLQNCEQVVGSRRLENSSTEVLVKGTLIAEGQLA